MRSVDGVQRSPTWAKEDQVFHLRDRHAESVNVSSKTEDGKSVSAR